MRRKSERTAAKKTKPSPEKKEEKPKRTRTRRRKQSSSSEESAEETNPALEVQVEEEVQPEKKPPTTPVKEDSPEEAQEQVWQVKTADASGDGGEIKKLKICLTRPPSTPERADRSPRSKRKHSHATSSSDTPSNEGSEERRKSRRRRRSTRESRDESEKNQDSQPEEAEMETTQAQEQSEAEVSQSTATQAQTETPMSTTNEEAKPEECQASAEVQTAAPVSAPVENTAEDKPNQSSIEQVTEEGQTAAETKSPDADTTVKSPKDQETGSEANTSYEKSPVHKRSPSVEKSEVLELHAEENNEIAESVDQEEETKEAKGQNDSSYKDVASDNKEVSINEDKSNQSVSGEVRVHNKATNENDVVEGSDHVKRRSRSRFADKGDVDSEHKERRSRAMSTDSDKDKGEEGERFKKELERSNSTQSHDEPVHNGEAAPPLVVNRKRRWGARKITTQKSITISSDVLKEIIPDVKPVEFNEVIEEKKHRRIEVSDKVERPMLPKIVIDNSENVEKNQRDYEENQDNSKREPLSANRRISILKDNDSIIARPPSPPRHKPSDILFITNLVRPFTLPQLKNLLQRTGRIVENGFWIDRIKSKCFVQYENEDQAVETRHALHGVTWPVSNPKALQVDFSTPEAFNKARQNEDVDNAQASTIPGTVEDWLREQDQKRERGELEKPWERKLAMREWDVGKGDKDNEKDGKPGVRRDERSGLEKRRHRSPEKSPEPARKFKKKEEEAPAKLLDDLFKKTKTTPCIYWLPLSAETIAIKEEQRRHHMAEHERRMQELRRGSHRRH